LGLFKRSEIRNKKPETDEMKIGQGKQKKCGTIDFIFYLGNGIDVSIKQFVRRPRTCWSKHYEGIANHFAAEAQIVFT